MPHRTWPGSRSRNASKLAYCAVILSFSESLVFSRPLFTVTKLSSISLDTFSARSAVSTKYIILIIACRGDCLPLAMFFQQVFAGSLNSYPCDPKDQPRTVMAFSMLPYTVLSLARFSLSSAMFSL